MTFVWLMAAAFLGGVGLNQACAKRSSAATQHRAAAEVCPQQREPGHTEGVEGTCKSDADCKDGQNGRCAPHGNGRVAPTNQCTYDSCLKDADCGVGKTCTCDGSNGNYCLPGNCRVDADCGKGGFCSPSYALCSLHGPYRPMGYYCHKSSDECMVDDDCPKSDKKGYGPTPTKCVYSAPAGHWVCETRECPVG